MRHFAGLDASLEETEVCVVDEAGRIIKEACGVAQIVRTGRCRAVHAKGPACRFRRALLAARRLVLNKLRDVENGLRASLREAGLNLGTPARTRPPGRVRELTAADPVLSAPAEPLLAIIATMAREPARLTKQSSTSRAASRSAAV